MSENKYGYVVVHSRGTDGSMYYAFQNERERKVIPNSLSLLAEDKVQIVTLSDLQTYAEYAPYTQIHNIRELFNYAGNLKLV